MITLAGEPKQGKTAWLLNMLTQIAIQKYQVAMITLEVSEMECWCQLIARQGMIPLGVVMNLKPDPRIAEIEKEVHTLPMEFYNPGLGEEEVCQSIRRAVRSSTSSVPLMYGWFCSQGCETQYSILYVQL